MEWYRVIFELIDMRSFSNLWYWIALAILWSSASHWVIGVPFDMISRAKKHGGKSQTDLEMLVGIYTDRILYISRTAGVVLVGFVSFGLTMLGVLAFMFAIEFAQAVLFLLAPMTIVGLLSIRTAGMIEAGENTGEALLRRLTRHRISVQTVGMISIFITSLFGMWQNMQIGALG